MGPLDIERFLKLPAAGGISWRLCAARINHVEVGGDDSKLGVERRQIGGGVGVIVGIHDGDGAASAGRNRSDNRRRASGGRRGKAIHAGKGSRRFKKAAAARTRRRSNASPEPQRCHRLSQFIEQQIRMRTVTDVPGLSPRSNSEP